MIDDINWGDVTEARFEVTLSNEEKHGIVVPIDTVVDRTGAKEAYGKLRSLQYLHMMKESVRRKNELRDNIRLVNDVTIESDLWD